MTSTGPRPRLSILGIRGLPARHGGFETFAEGLSQYLVAAGWDVTVYCQAEAGEALGESTWQGIRLVHLSPGLPGAPGTILFDWRATLHACRDVGRAVDGQEGLVLTLGYNTAIFSLALRLWRIRNLINMDGLEWRRSKYGMLVKAWFYINEHFGCWLGNHLIADHPAIADHLATRTSVARITTIAYGAETIEGADSAPLTGLGLQPGSYALVIARPEPENSILEIVRGFAARDRGLRLVVLGRYSDEHPYQRAVKAAAGPQALFPGAIYDKQMVRALRFHTALYIHGHQVGGTNPSLIEALGAGNAVLAHDNRFNRWVAGPDAAFFTCAATCAQALDGLLTDRPRLAAMGRASRARHGALFRLDERHADYEKLLTAWLPKRRQELQVSPVGTAP